MVVNYFGEGCFRLQSGEVSLLLNPENNRLKADVVLRTISPGNAEPPIDEISFPGEYEVKGIEIKGLPLSSESTDAYIKTAYVVRWEDMKFVFLGHASHAPGDDILEEMGEPDALVVPTGNQHFISPTEAAKLVKRLEPSLILPAYYKSANDFLKAMGAKGEHEEKFVFRKKDLVGHKSRLMVLEAKG